MRKLISQEIKKGIRPQGKEIMESDVGRSLDYGGGFGPVQSGDVGIKVWLRSYGIVMENREQRDT